MYKRQVRAEVEVLEIDFLALEASVRYLGLLHPAEITAADGDVEDEEEKIGKVGNDAEPTSAQ